MSGNSTITFRSMADADLEFSRKVYADSRKEEMDLMTNWSADDKAEFLEMQFQHQHQCYQQQFPNARFDIVYKDDEPVGRLYVDRGEEEILVIDIALMAAHRGSGLGSRLLREILDEARGCGKSVSISVLHNNRAQRLYQRLGFQPVEDVGMHTRMRWHPAAAADADPLPSPEG